MNCILFRNGKGLLLLLVACFLVTGLSAARHELPPPVFVDSAPADVTVDCYNDRPNPITLTAQTDAGNVEVAPRDSLALGTPTICSGGLLFRIWEITTPEGTAREEQQITFGPSSDGPTIDPTIDLTPDTVECTRVSDGDDPLSYESWLASKQLAVIAAVQEGCAPIVGITDDGPDDLNGADCDDQVTVTFTVMDQCLQEATVAFLYVVEDNTAPVISGDTMDINLECGQAIPPVPDVTVEDCTFDPVLILNEFNGQTSNGSCTDFEYEIQRSWTATDQCGNSFTATQTIFVADNEQPSFQRPFNLELLCTQDFEDLELTGNAMNLSDNCTPTDQLDLAYSDVIIFQPDCNFNFNVRRTWTVTDICGNTNSQVQNIFVGDNLAPEFTPPADITINCEDLFNFAVVGEPTDLFDACTPNPNVTYEDEPISVACTGNFRLLRNWRIFDDCGNEELHTQQIIVRDTVAPFFVSPASDLITTCNNEQNQEELFNLWIIDLAGARAEDLCSPSDSIRYEVFVSGTRDLPLLPPLTCGVYDQAVRELSIDIIATDLCGNQRMTTAIFRQIDTQAPELSNCPVSQVVATNPDFCGANILFAAPTVTDECVTGLPDSHRARDTVQITSNAAPGEEGSTPVNPIVLDFVITVPLPVNALLPSELIITLENADAEGTEEFFLIYGEDGILLDSTNRSDVQCDDSETILELSREQFNNWAVDGVVQITLEPFIPEGQPGTFAINDLCADGSRVIGYLRTPIRRLAPLRFEVFVDDNPPIEVDPYGSFLANIEAGFHTVTYRVTDCANNFDECLYTITVEDLVAPVVTCPEDIVIELDEENCTLEMSAPLPTAVVDNCSIYEVQTQQSPSETGDRFLTFNFDPNLNAYQANDIVADFSPIPPHLFDTVQIIIRFQGDFDSNDAILDVLTNDGMLLGSSTVGDADCGTEGVLVLNIPGSELNPLLEDGDFGLILRPRVITVPPGQNGDGVNPCSPDVNADGQNDGSSYAYAEIRYQVLRPDFYTTGATVTPRTTTTPEQPLPLIDFELGTTEVFYIVADPAGNIDSCSYTVTLNDNIIPTAVCQSTTIFLDPSGLEPVTIDPAVIDAGSTDNCTIDTVFLTPATFTCDLIGTTQNITLNVTDESGNTGTCSTTVGVSAQRPEPTADSGFCGGDTLFLFANPPTIANPGQTIYTFRWFNPDGNLLSTEENTFIPSVDSDDEGPYRVEITGISGCVAEGVVNVSIEDLPLTPSIEAPQSVCFGDEIPLSSPTTFIGDVVYQWYEGEPGSGTLLGTSPVPNFNVPGPQTAEGRDFYLEALVNGCLSSPSSSITVTAVNRPTIGVQTDSLEACEFDDLELSGIADPGVNEFIWTGPNDFSAATITVELDDVSPANSGTYYFQGARNEGCFTAVDSIIVEVAPAPPATTLRSNGPVCLGESLILTAANSSASAYTFIAPNGEEYNSSLPTLIISEVTFAQEGEWRVEVSQADCFSLPSEPLSVSVTALPIAQTMNLPDPVCSGNDLILQGSSNIGGSSYSWTGPNDFSSDLIAPFIEGIDESHSGDYILTVTSPNGCVDRDTLSIEVLEGVFVTGIEMVDDRCLSGGETIGLVGALSPIDANQDYNYTWTGPMGLESNEDTLFIPDVSPMNSGTYTLFVKNAAGCVSPTGIFTVDLQFAPTTPIQPITADGQIGYCIGENFTLATTDYGPNTTYFWQLPDGATITSDTNAIELNAFGIEFTGNYRVRVVREGCTSPFSEPTELIVTNFPDMAISANSPVCEGSPINLQVTDLAGATYSWRGPSNFSSSLSSPVIGTANPDLHNGLYRVAATIGGCVSDTLSITVEVQPKPRTPVGVPHQALCISDADASLTLAVNENTATDGATYQWFINNGAVPIGDPTDQLNITITDFSLFPDGGAIDFFVQTELDGCTSDLSNPITVRLDIVLDDAADAGRDTTICEGLYLLQAAAPAVGAGNWELVSGEGEVFIANPNSPNTAVSGMTEFNGPYIFVWSLSNGTCENYSRDTVEINATSGESSFAGEDILACLNGEVTLSANPAVEPGSVGTWSQNQSQEILGVEIVEPNNPNTIITGLQPDNVYDFTWTVQSTCGIKTDVVLVNVSDPFPDAGADEIVCNETASTILAAAEPTIGSSGSWTTIDPELTIEDPTSPTTMVGNLNDGENLFIWEIDGGNCGFGSTDTVIIEYKEPALPMDDVVAVPFQGTATFNPIDNDVVPEGSSVEFPNLPTIGTLEALPDGSFFYTAPPNFVGKVEIEYSLLSDGCTNTTATVTLNIGENADCGAPNIFTPNNDGVNDFFVVPCLLALDEYPESEVTIFNQWGDEVYRSAKPYRGDWDGRFNGEDLPVGTYFYIIEFGNDREADSGHVRIQR